MMTQAFYTGLSGLKTNQSAIDVTANNLANVNTVGYREYNTEFASLFESQINSTTNSVSNTIGSGVRLQSSTMNTQSGTLSLTDRNTDLAISGDGWFGVESNGEPYYTRAGNFMFDMNSDLVTPEGFYVLGTMGKNISDDKLTDVLTEIPLEDVTVQEKLSFPNTLSYDAQPSTNATFAKNLGVGAYEDEEGNVIGSDIATIAVGVIDKDGNRNSLNLTFTKSETQVAPNTTWNVVATTQTRDGESIYDTQNGVVEFDEQGGLISSTLPDSIDNNGTAVSMNLGESFTGITATQREATSGTSSSDGIMGGELLGYDIGSNAEIVATFSNGVQSSVGKIAVFHFQNEQGLEKIGGNKFRESSNSGEAIFFKDANGKIISGAEVLNNRLETSNVRMEVGLTELIILQRAYDANSKSITTADQMLKKALDM